MYLNVIYIQQQSTLWDLVPYLGYLIPRTYLMDSIIYLRTYVMYHIRFPGVMDCPRTCLHAILSLLNQGLDGRSGPTCIFRTPRLADLGYQLVYTLCANKDTSAPTMRYLRTHNFLYQHLQHLPFRLESYGKYMWITSLWWTLIRGHRLIRRHFYELWTIFG